MDRASAVESSSGCSKSTSHKSQVDMQIVQRIVIIAGEQVCSFLQFLGHREFK